MIYYVNLNLKVIEGWFSIYNCVKIYWIQNDKIKKGSILNDCLFKMFIWNNYLIQKENNCKVQFYLAKRKEDLAKGKEDLAKGKEDLAKGKEDLAKETGDYNKMIQILAMLDPKEARKYLNYEIKKIEIQLKTEKNDTTRKSLLYRLDILKSRLSELDKKVA